MLEDPITLFFEDGSSTQLCGPGDYALKLFNAAMRGERSREIDLIARSVESAEPGLSNNRFHAGLIADSGQRVCIAGQDVQMRHNSAVWPPPIEVREIDMQRLHELLEAAKRRVIEACGEQPTARALSRPLAQMIRQKLLTRIKALENTTAVCIEPKTIEVVFIQADGTQSKTAEPLAFRVGACGQSPSVQPRTSRCKSRGYRYQRLTDQRD